MWDGCSALEHLAVASSHLLFFGKYLRRLKTSENSSIHAWIYFYKWAECHRHISVRGHSEVKVSSACLQVFTLRPQHLQVETLSVGLEKKSALCAQASPDHCTSCNTAPSFHHCSSHLFLDFFLIKIHTRRQQSGCGIRSIKNQA